ncbi:MAG TPA: T9SS type A sorting domain-containing protein, partial [Chitinophagales bacterium]|nr:T9SS type A sorting domain-containing protein [Chitinophagales bacterium]HNL16586.1 T9SS type A sorting domain-containing protein [Chitinophagales bacterium]
KSFLTTLTNNQTYTVGQMITKTSGTITDTSYVGYVSANPNDTTFNITGLVDNARYWIAVIPYKNCPSGKNYRSQFIDNVNKNDTTTANSSTTCDDPGQAPEGLIFTSITKNSISGKFNKAVGGADAYLVLYRASSSFIVAPTDGQTYTVGQLITKVSGAYTDSSTIGYISSGPNDTTFTINGLDAGKLYWIAVIPFNNCPSGPSYRTVIITNVNKNDTSTSSPNAIKINKELNFSVYPNPVSNNRLNIQLDKSNIDAVRVQIVDITGRILFNGNIPEHTKVHQLEIANFGKGMYFLQLEDKNGLNTVPFLVQ